MGNTSATSGSAPTQRTLWGQRTEAWAEIQEGMVRPLYEAVLTRLEPPAGTRLLDVGCGAGMFCQIAAGRGLTVTGFDATPELLAIARLRAPVAVFNEGDLETLPYSDRCFDLVTGFNAFQYASQPVRALTEARRVTRPGGTIIIATWGKPEHCEAGIYLRALGSLLPPPPPGAPGPFALSADGALTALAAEAGLTPLEEIDVPVVWVYPDEATAVRGLLSGGPAVRAINTVGEAKVRELVLASIEPFRHSKGGYRLHNEFRYLIARV